MLFFFVSFNSSLWLFFSGFEKIPSITNNNWVQDPFPIIWYKSSRFLVSKNDQEIRICQREGKNRGMLPLFYEEWSPEKWSDVINFFSCLVYPKRHKSNGHDGRRQDRWTVQWSLDTMTRRTWNPPNLGHDQVHCWRIRNYRCTIQCYHTLTSISNFFVSNSCYLRQWFLVMAFQPLTSNLSCLNNVNVSIFALSRVVRTWRRKKYDFGMNEPDKDFASVITSSPIHSISILSNSVPDRLICVYSTFLHQLKFLLTENGMMQRAMKNKRI